MAFEAAVVGLPSNSLAFTNCVYVNFDDFMELVRQTPPGVTSKEELKEHGLNVWVNRKFVFATKPQKQIPRGSVAVGNMQRMCAGLPMGQACQLTPYVPPNPKSVLGSVTFEIQQVLTRAQAEVRVIDCSLLKATFEQEYVNQIFAVGQLVVVSYDGIPLRLQCVSIDLVDNSSSDKMKSNSASFAPDLGLFLKGAVVNFSKSKDAPVRLTNQSAGQSRSVFKPDFDFSKLGIGGLDKEFNDIFRRAFASRLFPTDVIAKLGIKHVRGMLLYGPPGCGKTLIARKISQALTAKEPKVVNGPEILDKFVGESERKIRELFSEARQDQQELGDESDVHIIIFDEIDAICKARGSSRDGTGVGDSVVNQLLTQIDGVDSLNNVLVIGMTNRKDMLDEALVRPGRLEVQIEINLPNEYGRAQIFKIHTDLARKNGTLHPEVIADLDYCMDPLKPVNNDPDYRNLAQRTKNFSGAEIEGLVRAANAHALSRGTDGKTFQAIANFMPQIKMEDFAMALEEVKPKFGAPSDQLSLHFKNGIVPYGKSFTDVKDALVRVIDQVRSNDKTPLMSVLLHGERGSGKTALATYCAVASEFPLVRLIRASELIARAENAKCSYIHTVFEEAYRSTLSIIILDDIERLIDYVGLGPRFSNLVLQALMVLIRNPVPFPDRKLVVIGVTSNIDAMRALELADGFDLTLEVPQLRKMEELSAVLAHTNLPVEDREKEQILQMMASQPISVKKLLLIAEMAKEDLANSGEDMITHFQQFKILPLQNHHSVGLRGALIEQLTVIHAFLVFGATYGFRTQPKQIQNPKRHRQHKSRARHEREKRGSIGQQASAETSTAVAPPPSSSPASPSDESEMAKKNKQQHKAANGGSGSAEQSPEGATKKKLQVGQTPGSNTSSPIVAQDKKKTNGGSPKKPQQDADAHVDMKEASEKVDSVLKRRKSIDEVHEAGILKTEEDLEKMAQISETMEEKIEARPNQEEMHSQNEHILNPTGANRRLSGSLASTAKELEKSMTSDKIDRLLVSRPDVDELEKMHVLNTNVAPQLQSVQKQLQRKMSADELSHRLDSRPDVQDLRDQGIVHDDGGVAPSLQATQEKLQRQINSDRVSHQLVKRPSITELTSQGVLEKNDTQMAPSLTATAKKLERNLVQNQVSHLLETRPDKDELVTHHILGDNEEDVAPSLQGPMHQLERQLKADQVARHLRKRPSIGELEEKGIIEEGEIGDENTDVNKKFALSRRARYTLALKAASRIAADNLITQDEKSRLKDRILSDDEKVVAAIECYELDHDVEEMLDTLYRVAKMV